MKHMIRVSNAEETHTLSLAEIARISRRGHTVRVYNGIGGRILSVRFDSEGVAGNMEDVLARALEAYLARAAE